MHIINKNTHATITIKDGWLKEQLERDSKKIAEWIKEPLTQAQLKLGYWGKEAADKYVEKAAVENFPGTCA